MVAPRDPSGDETGPDIAEANDMLAEWAARSATGSETLIERFEAMGYEVRGKSEDEIADILRHKPTRSPTRPPAP